MFITTTVKIKLTLAKGSLQKTWFITTAKEKPKAVKASHKITWFIMTIIKNRIGTD